MKQIQKRRMCVLLVFLLSVALSGCSFAGEEQKESGKISVVATIFPQYDFVREIAGDNVNLTMLLKPGSESHSYEPTPQDIITIQNCDVFLYVGGENDAWVEEILSSVDTSNMQIIALMNCVSTMEEETVEGMQEEHGHEEEETEAEIDEHVWTSPKNAIQIVEQISETLCVVDESNAAEYEKNTKNYVEQLQVLDEEFKSVVDQSEKKEIVFGDRFPLRYFAEEYGLTYYAAFPGCASDTEPSAATIAFLINKVKSDEIPVVFKIELSNGNMANAIADATGAQVLTFYSCHNITAKDMAAGETYLSLMKKNANSLKIAIL